MADKKPSRANPIEAEEEGKPYIPHNKILGLTKTKFPALLARRVELTATVKEAQAELETLNVRLLGMMAASGAERVECAGYRVRYSPGGTRKSLSKERLLELGVKPIILEKATVISQTAASITVLPPKEEKE